MGKAKVAPVIKLQRLTGHEHKTAYRVLLDGKEIGFVWSYRGHSYRGMQGWNRGIRLQDYHPTTWKYGPSLFWADCFVCYDRAQGVECLVRERAV
jgi:hypothetical protein